MSQTQKIAEIKEQLMLRPCKTREELYHWVKVFLNIDLPDSVIDPESNCCPLDMVWCLYRTAVWYHETPPEERVVKSIFYASRGSLKTLCSTIVELMIMLHTGRDVVHVGLQMSQAKVAYHKYFRPFLGKPYIKDRVLGQPIKEESHILAANGKETSINIIPCTLNATSGPRAHLLAKDEIDKTRGEQVQAYYNMHGMLTETPNKELPIEFGISTRDSAYGMVQEEINKAPQTGTKVFHWNLIDITEQCPDTRSGTDEIPIYIKKDSLYYIDHDSYMKLDAMERSRYEQHWGLKGCVQNCKLFAACKGFLKNQTSCCKWLKTIDFTQTTIMASSSEDMAIAQYLCRKPSSSGLVYGNDFDVNRNVKSALEMYRIFTGDEDFSQPITIDDFIAKLMEHKVPCYLGVDAGFHHPAAVLIFIDKSDRGYIVKEYLPEEVDSEELSWWLFNNWKKYNPSMCYVDPESPDCTRFIRKRGFVVSDRVDKNVQAGLATVKGFLKTPISHKARLFVYADCYGVKTSINRYRYRILPNGQYSDEPDKQAGFDHAPDAIRYVLHTRYGRASGRLAYTDFQDPQQQVKPAELLKQSAVTKPLYDRIIDNRKVLDSEKKEKTKSAIRLDFFDTGDDK